MRHFPTIAADAELAQCAEHVAAWRAQPERRPFRFEDLAGAPEPEAWGPAYPKGASAAVERWRNAARARALTDDEARAYGAAVHAWIGAANAVKPSQGLALRSNSASGQAEDFSAAAHRRKLIGDLASQAARDRAAWATSAEIREAYAAAMMAKAARLAREAAGAPSQTKRTALETPQPAPVAPPIAAPIVKRKAGRMPETATEAQRAKAWREAQGFTRAALAERSGFSASQIQDYEEGARRGKSGAAAEIGEGAWRRYRLVCAAIAAGLEPAW